MTTSNDTDVPEEIVYANSSRNIPGSELAGRTFYLSSDGKTWFDMSYGGEERYVADMGARGKESDQPNGGDFTVSWLHDGGAGGSVIDLGSADELYKTDALSADRRTLSDMTVDLDAGVNNVYGGIIIGEGSVIKDGDGSLTLTGANLYTGGTLVEKGTLVVDGSLASNVIVGDQATLAVNGSISSSVTVENTGRF